MQFDQVVAVDWSARSVPSAAKPQADAIFICSGQAGDAGQRPEYFRTRHAARAALERKIEHALERGQRMLLGIDISLGYPHGFAKALTGQAGALHIWEWLSQHIQDDASNGNNRFEIANQINRALGQQGPFWGRPVGRALSHVPMRLAQCDPNPFAVLRQCETLTTGAQPAWKLFTTGSVGSQVLLGLPHLWHLRQSFAPHVAIWPLEAPEMIERASVVVVESYFRLVPENLDLAADGSPYDIRDARQVKSFVDYVSGLAPATLAEVFAAAPDTAQVKDEGWTFGAGVWQAQPVHRKGAV
jgi:hypothetical protein